MVRSLSLNSIFTILQEFYSLLAVLLDPLIRHKANSSGNNSLVLDIIWCVSVSFLEVWE